MALKNLALKSLKEEKEKRMKKRSKLAILKDKADKLYQIKYMKLKPRSIISGEPTEVIHHFIQKKQSQNLRWDEKNGVPLTISEHVRHHKTGDPAIVAKILDVMGTDWFDDLQRRRRINLKLNVTKMKEIIKELEE